MTNVAKNYECLLHAFYLNSAHIMQECGYSRCSQSDQNWFSTCTS